MRSWPHRHREPPGPEADLSELLLHAAHQMRHGWAQSLAEWDLSPHQAMALRTADAEDGGRVSDLATRLRIAARSATEVVDGLEERGLVRRCPSPTDRRAVLVQVTEEGRALAARVEGARKETQLAMFDRLDDGEREQLEHLLRALIARD
ncbi:MarR family winged helix-turn-helix transcriptional regulator [Ruania zhangjianzhongii]|uniref:MarR family winged helix-turn-helix transcriptional regulator n=1 Tax=Ruania zhangjianzhongii TaxID=2603206 RepID=UPI001651CAB2|nr:MarR family transcriptional regulator [Ruania zhangjianzhongii]